MSKYHLKRTAKTNFLNVFRRAFTFPVLEKALVFMTLKYKGGFFFKLIPPDYLYKKESIRLVTREGIHYKLDISNVVDHGLYYGIQDSSYHSVMDVIRNAKVILDIGANIGMTALFFARITSNARILAFEPHPDTFLKLKDNVARNTFTNIELINLGLGEKKESLKLYEVNENNPGMNRIIPVSDPALSYKQIDVAVLDQVLQEKGIAVVDFIKLDVEGFEYFVLKGGQQILTQSTPVLFIELDDTNLRENNKSAKELIELLMAYGYTQFYRGDNLAAITSLSDFTHYHADIIAKRH